MPSLFLMQLQLQLLKYSVIVVYVQLVQDKNIVIAHLDLVDSRKTKIDKDKMRERERQTDRHREKY